MKYLFLLLIVLSSSVNAQVGINTDKPTRDLDINGNLYISKLEDKSKDSTYIKVLVTDKDGNVEAYPKNELKKLFVDETVETKELYVNNSPDENKIVPCGKFRFRFTNKTKPEIALIENKNITIYFTRIIKTSFKHTGKGDKDVKSNLSLDFSTTSNFLELNSEFNINNLNEYYLSYPNDNNMYRVTFLARIMTPAIGSEKQKNNYTIICEKF